MIASHLKWKLRLKQQLGGKGEGLHATEVGHDALCQLGRWLQSAQSKIGHLPEYVRLKDLHARFHRCAADVLRLHEQGSPRAERVLESDFTVLTQQTVAAIRALRGAAQPDSDSGSASRADPGRPTARCARFRKQSSPTATGRSSEAADAPMRPSRDRVQVIRILVDM
ncbi:CZB domain-containing protein [Pseudoxanthomonas mexicana]